MAGAGLGNRANASPEEIAALYDDWASGSYDADVAGWGYDAPERVAAIVAEHLGLRGGSVLDAGCGTGRVGAALRAAGIVDIVGGDFTPASVEAARDRGVYTDVAHLDLNGRLEFADDRFAVAVSVGVFSYVTDLAATIAELLRVVEPGGIVVFTQRTDLWAERDCDAVIASLVDAGTCDVRVAEPVPYLPGHPDFGADVGVIVATLTVR